MCLYLCRGYSINWKIQPISSVSAITLQWRSLQSFITPPVSLETQAVMGTSMQFPAFLHLVIVFQTHLLSSFICREGDVWRNHNRECNPRERKALERKRVLKGTCRLLVAIKAAITLTTLAPATFSQNVSSAMLQVALTFLKRPRFRMEHSPRKASI